MLKEVLASLKKLKIFLKFVNTIQTQVALLIVAILGVFLGYKFQMTSKAYILMATVGLTFFALQFILVFAVQNYSELTMLPALMGFMFMLFMFLGSLSRLAIRHKTETPS